MERPMDAKCALEQGMAKTLDKHLTDEQKAKLMAIKADKETK